MNNPRFYQAKAEIFSDGVMTRKTVNRALDISFGVLVISAFIGWIFTPVAKNVSSSITVSAVSSAFSLVLVISAIASLVLAIVVAIQSMPKPILVVLYSAAEGMLVGSISKTYEAAYQGIIITAVLATICVVAASYFVYRTGIIKVNQKFLRFLFVASIAYIAFSLVNVVLVVVGVFSGYGLFATQFGPFISVFAIVLGALMLVSDFAIVDQGINAGAPAQFSWKCAFGIMLSVIWIYFEILRLLAVMRDSK